jgi:competence protein ComEC
LSPLAGILRAHPRQLVAGALVGALAVGWRSPLLLLLLVVTTALVVTSAKLNMKVSLALVAAILAGTLFADLRLASLDRSQLTAQIGHSVRTDVTFAQAPRRSAFGWSALGKLNGEPVLIRGAGRSPQLTIGEIANVGGSLRPLTESDAWLAVQHVRAILKVRSLTATGNQRGGALGVIDAIRARATAALSAQLPAAEAGLLRGMTLGDDSAMPTELRDAMRRSGLGHLVAASGANVALLVLLVFAAGAALKLPRWTRLIAALFAVALYVPLAGSGASIQRAAVMGAAGLVAALASRPSSRWYALLLAAVVTLAFDPLAAEQPGWQLSFAAVAAIGLLCKPLRSALEARGLPPLISQPMALTAAATLGSAPVAAAAFGTLSLVSLPANLAAALLVAPVTWLGMLAALAGQLSSALAAPLSWLAYWPLSAIVSIARISSAVPGAQVDAAGPAVAAGCIGVSSFVLFGRGRRYAVPLGALGAALLAGAVLIGSHHTALAAPPSGTVRVSFLDVGQGDATLLQSEGHAALVDSGPPGAGIVDRLRSEGIERLDLLVATHAQADHLGGADEVLSAMPVAALLDGRDGVVESEGMQMAASAREHHVPLIAPSAGGTIGIGAIRLEICSPRDPAPPSPGGDPNQRAIVILARAPSLSVLLTADAESDVLAPLALPSIDLFKVSHHGSADQGLSALLEHLQPRIAVIEVGAGNSYGHPTAETLGALSKASVLTLRTDKDGTVRIDADRDGLRVQPPI